MQDNALSDSYPIPLGAYASALEIGGTSEISPVAPGLQQPWRTFEIVRAYVGKESNLAVFQSASTHLSGGPWFELFASAGNPVRALSAELLMQQDGNEKQIYGVLLRPKVRDKCTCDQGLSR